MPSIDQIWLYIAILCLIVLCLFLFFSNTSYQRDRFELQQDLRQVQQQFEQLSNQHQSLLAEKSQLEQWAIQQQTQVTL